MPAARWPMPATAEVSPWASGRAQLSGLDPTRTRCIFFGSLPDHTSETCGYSLESVTSWGAISAESATHGEDTRCTSATAGLAISAGIDGKVLAAGGAGARADYDDHLNPHPRSPGAHETGNRHQNAVGMAPSDELAPQHVVRHQRRPLQGAAHRARSHGASLCGLRTSFAGVGSWRAAPRAGAAGAARSAARASSLKELDCAVEAANAARESRGTCGALQ